MSATVLTHYAKIQGSIAQNCEGSRQDKRQGVKDGETSLQQIRLPPLHSLGENSKRALKGGRLELSLPLEWSTPIYRKMSQHDTSPGQQIPVGMRTY